MHHVAQMLESHPQAAASEALGRCVAACAICSQSCTSCADACLAEESVGELRRCIRLTLDCADVCVATGRVLSRQTDFEPTLARARYSKRARRRAAPAPRSASGMPST